MNLVYDDRAFLNPRGGISRYFITLIHGLKNLDFFQYSILCPIYKNYWLKDSNLDKNGKFIKFNVPNFLLRRYNDIINYNKKFNKKFLFHETYYGSKLHSKYLAGKILTVYDCIVEKFPHLFFLSNDFLRKKKKSIKEADHIICISQNTANDLKDIYGIAQNKYSVIYLGTNFLSFNKNLNYINKGKFFLYVGERSSYKNFNLILKAFSQSDILKKNYNLIAFGGGKFNKTELDLIKYLSLPKDRIINVSGDDDYLASLYSHAEALIVTSIYEGFSLPLIEAFALGCPVLCAQNSSLLEIGKDCAIFFDHRHASDLKNVLENFVLNSSQKNILKKKCFTKSKEFSIENMCNKTLDVYKNFYC
jgi:glycosyltransferase involved in cell wall biosynthesis